MPQTAYIVRCAHRTNGQPYTVNINADNPTAAKASAANTGHIVEHVMLANDPLAITPAPGVSSETLMQKAMLEEMRALRASSTKIASHTGGWRQSLRSVGLLLFAIAVPVAIGWLYTHGWFGQ